VDKDFKQELMSLIKERRSVRSFNGAKICEEDILSIIEAGTWAPTGCNNQELRFLILDEEEELREILKFKPFFRGVSTVVLILCDMSLPMSYKMYHEYKHERHLPYIDTGLALANMILYAKSKGIESCVFNLSRYHFRRSGEKKIIKKLISKIKLRLGLYKLMENNFEFYLRNHIKLPGHLKIMCGVAFGFAEKYPDVNTFKHGGRRIMRQHLDYYILQR
jgi:hypothetical protein